MDDPDPARGGLPVRGPGLLLRFIGVAEVLGALGLILPGALRIRTGLTPVAAAGPDTFRVERARSIEAPAEEIYDIAKVMSLFVSMDNLLGKKFETGLANMKAIAEAAADVLQ